MSTIDAGNAGTSGEGDSIKVFVRVRPPMNDGDHTMCLECDCSRNAVIMQSKPEPKVFTFDHVADKSVTQESVFSTVGKKIIESCIGGYNGTIFAYGQTGSGKTFTMLGPSENSDNFQHELRGVIPRSFEYLFTLVKREIELHGEKVQFLTKCSFLEIYNEQIYDLLDEASVGLHLRENIKKGVFVDCLIEKAVNNAAEAYDVLSTGWMNRTVASTSMNRESSRSHAVFTLAIESKTLKNGVWNMKASQLNLVDLAGSERQKDTHTTGARLKEAGSINKSLSVLGNVIMSLVDIAHGKARHVPYRDSKLSFLLRDSLGGNAKTCIIACIHPGAKSFGETMSTLLFARRAKMIKNKAVINEDAQGSVTHLQAEIKRLKEMVQQLQQNGPVSSSLEQPDLHENKPSEENSNTHNLRRYFLQAMHLWERIKLEKQDSENKCVVMQGKVDKMDKQLRSKEMVLKFRTNSLKIYENVKKEKRDLQPEEKEGILENLKSEIEQLQDQIQHHPFLGKMKLENDHLKSENIQLKLNRKNIDEIDRQRANELEKIHHDLISEKEKEGTPVPVYCTPQDTEKVSTATLERQKSQIETLQKNIEKLQDGVQSEKESNEKEVIKLRSELDSWKTRYDEVVAVQKSQCISGQIEREERDRLHIETIRNMTPKKYNLRNRTIIAACEGKELSFSLDDSVEADDIMSEEKPVDMYDTLEEELKKNREENSQLHSKIEEKDSLLVDKASDISRLLSERSQLTQILEKERSDWTTKTKEYNEQIQLQNKEISHLQENTQRLTETTSDLNVMMDGMEKKIKELKSEKEALTQEKHTTLAELSTKVMQLENEKVKLESDYANTIHECEKLREEVEIAQTTTMYTKDQIVETETKLSKKEAELSSIQTSYQDLLLKHSRSEENGKEMLSQLQKINDEAGDKQQELINLMESKKVIEGQYEDLCEELNHLQSLFKTTENRLIAETEEVKRLSKAEKEIREVNQSLCGKNFELKQLYEDSKDAKSALEQQLSETCAREDVLQQRLEERDSKVKELDICIITKDSTNADLETELQRKKVQYEIQQDDLESALKENDIMKDLSLSIKAEKDELNTKLKEKEFLFEDLKKSFDTATDKNKLLDKNFVALKADKVLLQEKLNKAEVDIKDLRHDLYNLQSNSASQISSLVSTQQQLDEKQSKMHELEHQIDCYTKQMQEKQILIDEQQVIVKEKCDAVESYRRAQDLLQSQIKELHNKFQVTIEDRDKKALQINVLQEKEKMVGSLENELKFAVHQAAVAEESVGTIQARLAEVTSSLDVSETLIQKLEFQLVTTQQTTEEYRTQSSEFEEECNRLRTILEEKSKDIELHLSELNQVREQNIKVLKRNEELNEEIAKIGSHANHLQKISLLHKRTTEVNQLREENNSLNKEVSRLRLLSGIEHKTPTKGQVHKDKENTPLKEFVSINNSSILNPTNS